MNKTEYKEKDFEEVMEQLSEERDDITTYEELKEFAKVKIDEDYLFLSIHILEALKNNESKWYEFDYCMGTLQTPSAITEKQDIKHLIDD